MALLFVSSPSFGHTKIIEPSLWEYAQFVSQEELYQWIEHEQLITSDSQQGLLRRLGEPREITTGQFINDLIVLNYAGRNGWELISVVNPGPAILIYTFKRSKDLSD